MDIEETLHEIAGGTLSREIAARYGVTPYAVRKRLMQHPEYQTAIAEQAESFVEKAMQQVMECAQDDVVIARARVDAAFKYAAARDPAKWGPRQHIVVDDAENYRDVLRTVAEVRQSRIRHVMSNDTDATLVSGTEQGSPTLDVSKRERPGEV